MLLCCYYAALTACWVPSMYCMLGTHALNPAGCAINTSSTFNCRPIEYMFLIMFLCFYILIYVFLFPSQYIYICCSAKVYIYKCTIKVNMNLKKCIYIDYVYIYISIINQIYIFIVFYCCI